MSTPGAQRITEALSEANRSGRSAVVGFLTGGYPNRTDFPRIFMSLSQQADVMEVGIPFTDPMADGVTIQQASERALADGTTLQWIIDTIAGLELGCPVVAMSYLNPILQFGYRRFAREAKAAGIDGLIAPDLPLEEAEPVMDALNAEGLALVQLVTPATPPARMKRLCEASRGFVYAVTRTGVTGVAGGPGARGGSGATGEPGATGGLDGASPMESVPDYLERVRALSPLPVLAGFGIRTADDVRALSPHTDGVIVGSAVIESLERGEDPAQLLWALKLGGRRH